MGPTARFVYILLNEKGEFLDVFAKRVDAERELPEQKANKRTQLNRTDWAYGSHPKQWRILERKVLGADGLPIEPKEYRHSSTKTQTVRG